MLSACEDNIYQADPRFFNDAMHGNITGAVTQANSQATVIVSQVNVVAQQQVDATTGAFAFEDLEIGNYDVTIQSEKYGTWKKEGVKIEGGGTTYLGQITLSDLPDLVASHYPEDKAEIVYNNRYSGLAISVSFTEPMNRESVEAAFSTDPPTEGIFTWGVEESTTYPIYWGRSDYENNLGGGATPTTYSKVKSFTYRIVQRDCYVDTTYNVTIAATAMDSSGTALQFPLHFSFSTVQSSQTTNAILTTPSHGDIEVSPIASSGMTITFPRKMNKQSVEEAINISPNTGNEMFIWPDGATLRIYTGGLFLADTKYAISIDSTAKDIEGQSMGNPFSFEFETAMVMVTSTYPQAGEVYVSQSQTLRLNFNSYIQLSTLKSGFSIEPQINGSLNYSGGDSKTSFVFTPYESFKPNTKYTVFLSSTIKDINNKNLEDGYSFSFITRP